LRNWGVEEYKNIRIEESQNKYFLRFSDSSIPIFIDSYIPKFFFSLIPNFFSKIEKVAKSQLFFHFNPINLFSILNHFNYLNLTTNSTKVLTFEIKPKLTSE